MGYVRASSKAGRAGITSDLGRSRRAALVADTIGAWHLFASYVGSMDQCRGWRGSGVLGRRGGLVMRNELKIVLRVHGSDRGVDQDRVVASGSSSGKIMDRCRERTESSVLGRCSGLR